MNLIFGTKIRITGDRINAKEISVIITNHRTRIDWNFMWAAMYYACQPQTHRLKIALKAPLRHMPSLGNRRLVPRYEYFLTQCMMIKAD